MLTASQLAACTEAPLDRAQRFVDFLNAAMSAYAIDTPQRQAAFLAQIGHETLGLKFTSEIWGPTPAQVRYEMRLDLGNTEKGDGFRFRGHGLIHTTGRFNHAKVRDRLRVRFGTRVPDFEAMPELLSTPEWASFSAADYWDMKGINARADRSDFDGVSDLVNRGRKTPEDGDSNGWADRKRRWGVAKKVLGLI